MAAEMDIEKTPNEIKAEAMLKKLESIGAKVFFEKQLTSSDVSASGRVVVPKVWCDLRPAWLKDNQNHCCATMGWGSGSARGMMG